MITALGTMSPRLTDLCMEATMFRLQQKDQPPHGPDSLYEPQRDGRRRGTSDRYTMRTSAYTRAAMSEVGRVLPFIAAGAVVAASLRARRKAS
jgi:hypothetical protein